MVNEEVKIKTKTIDKLTEIQQGIFYDICKRLEIFPADTNALKEAIVERLKAIHSDAQTKISHLSNFLKFVEGMENE